MGDILMDQYGRRIGALHQANAPLFMCELRDTLNVLGIPRDSLIY